MKYLKILGLAAVAAMALMAFAASSASATTLTDGNGNLLTELDASLVGSAELTDTSGNVLDTCTEGTVSGTIDPATQHQTWVSGASLVTWGGCTRTTDTINGGTLDIDHIGGGVGTVKSTGAIVTVNAPIIGSCLYGTGEGVDLGTVSSGTESHLTINAMIEEQAPKRLACPDTTRWVATYVITEPHELVIEG